jgi:hypothetical protein
MSSAPVKSSYLWVPYLMLRSWGTSLDLFQNDGLWPCPVVQLKHGGHGRFNSPLIVDREEFADYRGGSSCRIQLANTRRQHRPSHTTRETQDVGIDSSFCSSAPHFID